MTTTGKRIAPMLGRLWVGLLVGAFIGLAVGAAWTTMRKTEYTATTIYYLRPPQTSDTLEALTADIYAFNRAKLYTSLISSTELADRVAKRTNTDRSAVELAASISASDIYQTSLITTTVVANSGDQALLIARGYAAELPGYASRVEKGSGLQNADGLITAVDGPRLTSTGGIGELEAIAAAVVSFALLGAAGMWWGRRRYLVVDAVAIGSSTGIPVYAQLDARDQPASDRMLARVMSEPQADGLLTLVSPRTGDGATVLAKALSEAGDRLGIAVRVGDSDAQAALHISCRAILAETPTSRLKATGPQLLVVRQHVTTQRNLLAALRILRANDAEPPLGIVMIKQSSVLSWSSARRRSGAAEQSIPAEVLAAPVRN